MDLNSCIDIEFPQWEYEGNIDNYPFTSLEDTPYTFIETEQGIRNLITSLKQYKAVAVNVIQHSYRSYLGYCSIIMVFIQCGMNSYDRFHLQMQTMQLMQLNAILTAGFWMICLPIQM